MTERLYDADSHRREFTATVGSCSWNEKRKAYEVILDRTVFFPEGGGQYADSGVLGGILVEDVKEQGEEVLHILKEPLEVGSLVEGRIDYEERFSNMQQHSGEHIVSGLIHRCFGYDNVGFHLGKELTTMDYNGPLTWEQLRKIEWEANKAVAENVEIRAVYPTAEELQTIDYRSKKELTGPIRIVTIPGYDVCACCAPHVSRTGEIGMIRLVDVMAYKGGVRVTMVCGFRALLDTQKKEDNVREISRLLSVKPYEAAEAAVRLKEEENRWRGEVLKLQNRILEEKLEQIGPGTENCVFFEDGFDRNVARRFVDAAKERCEGICAMFLSDGLGGYSFLLGSRNRDLSAFLSEFYQVFDGKGGGRGQMVQGTVRGFKEERDQPGGEPDLQKALLHYIM